MEKKICSACGGENSEGAKFCATCGVAMAEEPSCLEEKVLSDSFLERRTARHAGWMMAPWAGGGVTFFVVMTFMWGHQLPAVIGVLAFLLFGWRIAIRILDAYYEKQKLVWLASQEFDYSAALKHRVDALNEKNTGKQVMSLLCWLDFFGEYLRYSENPEQFRKLRRRRTARCVMNCFSVIFFAVGGVLFRTALASEVSAALLLFVLGICLLFSALVFVIIGGAIRGGGNKLELKRREAWHREFLGEKYDEVNALKTLPGIIYVPQNDVF